MGSLANNALWGSLVPGGEPDAVTGVDTGEVLDRILPVLHADTRENLTYWSVEELLAAMDDAVKRLARRACVFVGRDANTLTAAGTAAYSLPARHISTLHVSRASSALAPANQIELEALDDAYQTTPGTPLYWYQDQLGQSSIGLAPVPNAEETLAQLYEGWPTSLDGAGLQPFVPGPSVLRFYLAMAAIAAAYGREGDMHMPEVAAHCHEQVSMMDAVFVHLWGAGQ